VEEMLKSETTEPTPALERYAYQFWPDAPDGPTIVAGKYCYMAADFYGRLEIVWQFDQPTLSVGVHEWWNFFSMTNLHQALQVEKAAPEDIIVILTRLGFEDISERGDKIGIAPNGVEAE
jgi:hypothetical protein